MISFLILCFLAHADSDSYRHAALHVLRVTRRGYSDNGVMGTVFQKKLPNNKICF